MHGMQKLLRNQSGGTAIEYGMILALIVLVVIVGFQLVEGATKNTYNTVTNAVGDATAR